MLNGVESDVEKVYYISLFFMILNRFCLRQPCLLTERDEISILYRGPSIDASYQVSVQLAKQFQGRRFLEIDQSETRIACGGHDGRFCINFPQSRMKGERHRHSPLSI
jgi:hypothetical protein